MPVTTRTLGDILRGKALPTVFGKLDMSSAVRGIRITHPTTKKNQRIERGRKSFRAFCTTYLGHHFTKGFNELHLDIFAAIENPAPKKRILRIAPRMFGKTTIISLALVVWSLAYQKKRFILMIAESGQMAEGNLGTVTQELESNEMLLEDFPHLLPARDGKGQVAKWTDSEIQVRSMATVVAKGTGSRMRGLKRGKSRPDLAIVDDPESPETADTFLKRRKHKRWWGGTFLGLGGEEWDVYVIANLPHHDALVADLAKSEDWDAKLYRAINIPPRTEERYPIGNTKTDGSPLWPEVWPHERLDAYRNEPNVGGLAFAREMMNDPREEEEKIFDYHRFTYMEFRPVLGWQKQYPALGLFVDPAGGEKPGELRRGVRDFCCIVFGGRTRDGYIDILDVELVRKPPEAQIRTALDLYARYQPRFLGVEENMFKNLYEPSIAAAARKRGLYPSIRAITHTTNKIARIQGLEPLVMGGTVRFNRTLLTKWPEYFAQFDEFPATFDDGPDATEGLVRMLEKGKTTGVPTGLGQASHWKGAA